MVWNCWRPMSSCSMPHLHGVIRTLSTQASRHQRKPTTLYGLLSALNRAGAGAFADEVRRLTS